MEENCQENNNTTKASQSRILDRSRSVSTYCFRSNAYDKNYFDSWHERLADAERAL